MSVGMRKVAMRSTTSMFASPVSVRWMRFTKWNKSAARGSPGGSEGSTSLSPVSSTCPIRSAPSCAGHSVLEFLMTMAPHVLGCAPSRIQTTIHAPTSAREPSSSLCVERGGTEPRSEGGGDGPPRLSYDQEAPWTSPQLT